MPSGGKKNAYLMDKYPRTIAGEGRGEGGDKRKTGLKQARLIT